MHEMRFIDMPVSRHERTAPIVLVHFAVTEHIAPLQQFVDEFDTALVIGRKIVAIREVEWIDVIVRRRKATIYNFKCFDIGGGADCTAALAASKEFIFGDLLRLCMMRDEHNFHFLVLLTEEAGHPEEETSCAIFFEAAHGARGLIMNYF